MSLPRYPRYKDSGVEWLGEVPEHWEVGPFKRVIERVESGTSVNAADTPADYDSYGVLKTSCVYEGYFDPAENKRVLESEINRVTCPLRAGTLIVSRMNTADLVGAAGLVKEAPANLFLPDRLWQVVLQSNEVLPEFAYQWTRSNIYRNQIKATCTGTSASMKNLGQSDFGNFVFVKPSLAEQSLVTTFLDRETAKIDALVAEQWRLIELLKEKRQAVISHAVTKGLNPAARMKPSGIEWLGEVPEHWSVAAVRFRYNVQLGKMLDSNKITGQHLRPYLRVFDVQWGAINVDDLPQMDFDPTSRDRFRLALGDLLINEGGSYPGRSAIWRGELDECYFQKALHRLKPCDPIQDTTQFFFYIMAWATDRGVFTAGGNESTIEHLPAEKFRKYRFAFPPIKEQLAIATFLDHELAKFDALTFEAQRAVDLLQERRTALISAAVTGKIDVREFADTGAA